MGVVCSCRSSEEIQPSECCSASSLSLLPLPPKSHPTIPGTGPDPCSCLALSVLPPAGPSQSKPSTSSKVSVWHSPIISEARAPCAYFSYFYSHWGSTSRWMPGGTCFWMQPGHKPKCTPSRFCYWGANGWVFGCSPATYLRTMFRSLPSCRALAPELPHLPLCNSGPSFHLRAALWGGRKHTCRWGIKAAFTDINLIPLNITAEKFSSKLRKYLAWILSATSSLHRGAACHQGRWLP